MQIHMSENLLYLLRNAFLLLIVSGSSACRVGRSGDGERPVRESREVTAQSAGARSAAETGQKGSGAGSSGMSSAGSTQTQSGSEKPDSAETEAGVDGSPSEQGEGSPEDPSGVLNSNLFRYQMMSYGTGGNVLSGFYMRDATLTAPGPGLVLLHGASGLSDGFRKNMERFAAQGFRVFAPDLFAGRVPSSEAEGRELFRQFDLEGKAAVSAMISSAADHLLNQLDANMVGLIGWDEGGRWAVSASLIFKYQFKAVVNFYGSPFELTNQGGEITTPGMHVFVQQDPAVDITEVISLEQQLAAFQADPVIFHKFRGVSPNFLDPAIPESARDETNVNLAYKLTFEFLDKYLPRQ